MKYTVLVVDDEEELRQAVIERVRWGEAGFEVVGEAENGVEALDLIDELEPDLILTDIRMPMISGLELARRVREMRPATQIVILSGYDSFEYARTAIDYNIISYLLSPFRPTKCPRRSLRSTGKWTNVWGSCSPRRIPICRHSSGVCASTNSCSR